MPRLIHDRKRNQRFFDLPTISGNSWEFLQIYGRSKNRYFLLRLCIKLELFPSELGTRPSGTARPPNNGAFRYPTFRDRLQWRATKQWLLHCHNTRRRARQVARLGPKAPAHYPARARSLAKLPSARCDASGHLPKVELEHGLRGPEVEAMVADFQDKFHTQDGSPGIIALRRPGHDLGYIENTVSAPQVGEDVVPASRWQLHAQCRPRADRTPLRTALGEDDHEGSAVTAAPMELRCAEWAVTTSSTCTLTARDMALLTPRWASRLRVGWRWPPKPRAC